MVFEDLAQQVQVADLRRLQKEVEEWTAHNFPERLAYRPLLGMGEELGELNHAHLKSEQNIRGTQAEHRAAKIDALADLFIYAADYANMERIDLTDAINQTWDKVKARDWQTNPKNGGNGD